jgi:hypothetical protein
VEGWLSGGALGETEGPVRDGRGGRYSVLRNMYICT